MDERADKMRELLEAALVECAGNCLDVERERAAVVAHIMKRMVESEDRLVNEDGVCIACAAYWRKDQLR